MYYIIVFENLRFRPSTRTPENSVFKKFHSGECFRKVPFSLILFMGCVWTETVSVKKKLHFQIKTDTCGQGLNVVPNSNPLGIKRYVSGISISFKCECHIMMKIHRGTQQPKVSKCARSVSDGFLYALEACFVNLALP